jgi:hypothetical protein
MSPELLATLWHWLGSDDPVERAHAAWRLAQPDVLPPGPPPIPLPESLALLRLVKTCPYRSRDAGCGCSGHRCALRTATPIVSHQDCLDCMRTHGLA